MTKSNVPQSKKKLNNRPLADNPEVTELLLDAAEFSEKFKPSKIAKATGTSKANIAYHLRKRKEKK